MYFKNIIKMIDELLELTFKYLLLSTKCRQFNNLTLVCKEWYSVVKNKNIVEFLNKQLKIIKIFF